MKQQLLITALGLGRAAFGVVGYLDPATMPGWGRCPVWTPVTARI